MLEEMVGLRDGVSTWHMLGGLMHGHMRGLQEADPVMGGKAREKREVEAREQVS